MEFEEVEVDDCAGFTEVEDCESEVPVVEKVVGVEAFAGVALSGASTPSSTSWLSMLGGGKTVFLPVNASLIPLAVGAPLPNT